MRFREYIVSPTFFETIFGPNPKAKASTLIPHHLATKKCPSSWTNISKAKTIKNIITVIRLLFLFPSLHKILQAFYCAHPRAFAPLFHVYALHLLPSRLIFVLL